MVSDSDRRDLLERVVSEIAPAGVEVDWLRSEGWSAHARLQGASGRVGYLLTSPEWQEARFAEPHRSTFMLTDRNDRDDLQQALQMLARAVAAYIDGDYAVEFKRGFFGRQKILVLHTPDGLWRIAKRAAQRPRAE